MKIIGIDGLSLSCLEEVLNLFCSKLTSSTVNGSCVYSSFSGSIADELRFTRWVRDNEKLPFLIMHLQSLFYFIYKLSMLTEEYEAGKYVGESPGDSPSHKFTYH